MNGTDEDFEARWRSMGLEDTLGGTTRDTIRGGTLSFSQRVAKVGVPADATDAEDVTPLPRISLATRAATNLSLDGGRDLTLVRRLGEGGMGVVELATQRSIPREVAVKRLREGADEARVADALLHEGRTTGKLEHPGVVPVHALGLDDADAPVLVMKRVEGVTLNDLVEDPAHPFWQTFAPDSDDRIEAHLGVVMQVCKALQFAHSRGVLHRDIKPDNVMIGAFGEVYLLDWGVALERAALTDAQRATQQLVGTPCFMAPEMFEGLADRQDERTDVYLLGATLHTVLTGRPRHEGANFAAVFQSAWLSKPVVYPREVPEELAALCNEATDREPSRRPESAEAFRRRIALYLRHRGSTALTRSAGLALSASRAAPEDRRLLVEAHFGFVQALREWPENAAANEGLDACLLELATRELSRKNPEGARGWIDEMRHPPESLRAELDALTRAVSDEQRAADAGRQHARDMDSSGGVSARVFMALIGLTAITLIGLPWGGEAAPESDAAMRLSILKMDLEMLAFVSVASAVMFRRLFANKINRQLSSLVLVLFCGMSTSTAFSCGLRSDVRTLVAQRFMVVVSVLAVGAVTVEPALAAPAGITLASNLVMALWPASAVVVGFASNLLVAAALIWAFVRNARRQRAGQVPAG